MKLSSVDVLLTNFCNQSCPFCFARLEMANSKKKQMLYKDFRFLVAKLREAQADSINFLGGEPTLHKEFPKILELAMKNFIFVRIFTNGIFPKNSKQIIRKYLKRIYLNFNVSTPSFINQPNIREIVMNNISEFVGKTQVTLAVTDVFQNNMIKNNVFAKFDRDIIKKANIRIGIMTPIVNDKNLITIEDFPNIGNNICPLIKYLEEIGPPRRIGFNTGMTPCMFNVNQRKFLADRGISIKPDCHLGFNDVWFNVSTDLSTFKCFPLSSIDIFNITKDTDLKKLRLKYLNLQKRYNKIHLLHCEDCPVDKKIPCNGPCIAFRINSHNNIIKRAN
jgi:organic radical activating enzyme